MDHRDELDGSMAGGSDLGWLLGFTVLGASDLRVLNEKEFHASYARLLVRLGANLAPGQPLFVVTDVTQVDLVREIAREAYRAGAAFVDVHYADSALTRAQAELGPQRLLDWTPSWMVARVRELQERDGALIYLIGANPAAMRDVDPIRAAAVRMPAYREADETMRQTEAVNWVAAVGPTEAWAEQVLGKRDVAALCEILVRVLRLDALDPAAAWLERFAELRARRHLLDEMAFDGLHYLGPGTDLRVGLSAPARWASPGSETKRGRRHFSNIPSEEVFTTPDRRRAEGNVRATRPLVIRGVVVDGLALALTGGQITEVSATVGAEIVRADMAIDSGASHLGEVALVDGSSRASAEGLTFFNTLFDENCACHIAWGNAITRAYSPDSDPAAINHSAVHQDFMVGGPDVRVFGIERGGREVLILDGDDWRLS